MGTGATGAQRQSETGPHSALVGGSRITCHNRHMLSANAGDAVKTRTAQTAWQEDTVEGPPAGVTAARMTATRGCERFCRAQPVWARGSPPPRFQSQQKTGPGRRASPQLTVPRALAGTAPPLPEDALTPGCALTRCPCWQDRGQCPLGPHPRPRRRRRRARRQSLCPCPPVMASPTVPCCLTVLPRMGRGGGGGDP